MGEYEVLKRWQVSTTYKNVQSLVFQCDVFFQILQLLYTAKLIV